MATCFGFCQFNVASAVVAFARLPRRLLIFALCVACSASAGPNPDLDRAIDYVAELEYPEAYKALDAAYKRKGNDRQTIITILEQQGVVAGIMNQASKSRRAFEMLFVVYPDHQLASDYAPRVTTPYFEAKNILDERGSIQLVAPPPTGRPVEKLSVQVTDPLKMGQAVRFHWSSDGGAWRTETSPLASGAASVKASGVAVKWWAELLNPYEGVLAISGSEAAPLYAGKPPVVSRAPVKEAPRVALPMPPPPRQGGVLRPAGLACLGLAAVAGGAGGYFGWRSNTGRARIQGLGVDESGFTIGMSQREAYALDAEVRSNAQLANGLLLGAAGAAVAGGVLWLLGAPAAVAPAPGGAVVQGTFP